jgi:hypothetical protein
MKRVRMFWGYAGFNHCEIKWDGQDDRSMVIVHDNSTNGTWVRVFCYRTSSATSVVPPPPPMLDASERARAHTLTLTSTRTDQPGTRYKRTICPSARRKRDRVWLADATANSIRGLPLHIQASRPNSTHGHPRALRHGARARSRYVRDGHEGDGTQHRRVVGGQNHPRPEATPVEQ